MLGYLGKMYIVKYALQFMYRSLVYTHIFVIIWDIEQTWVQAPGIKSNRSKIKALVLDILLLYMAQKSQNAVCMHPFAGVKYT